MVNDRDLTVNKKAFFDYEILESFETGIMLVGTEVKSLREGGGNLLEGYVTVTNDELWLLNASIAPYKFGNVHNHEERRPRKLLMHKREIAKLAKSTQEKGFTLIPLAMYLVKGKVKVKIAIAKGKKHHDKRKSIQEKEEKRNLDRAMKR